MHTILMWWLKARERLMLAQIGTVEDLAADHAQRAANKVTEYRVTLNLYHLKLRKIRQSIVAHESPQQLMRSLRVPR